MKLVGSRSFCCDKDFAVCERIQSDADVGWMEHHCIVQEVTTWVDVCVYVNILDRLDDELECFPT